MATNNRRQLTKEQAAAFDKAHEKLTTFHADIEKLSNKKPDGQINAFKLGFINQVLGAVNQILGDEYRPFSNFATFDVEGSLPSASDVVMMLSQYGKAMAKFRQEHEKSVSTPAIGLEGLGVEHTYNVWDLSDAGSSVEPEGSEAEEDA